MLLANLTRCSLLAACCSLLAARCSLLMLLAARCSLLAARCSLHAYESGAAYAVKVERDEGTGVHEVPPKVGLGLSVAS